MVEFLNRAAAAFIGGFLGWNNFAGRTRRRDYWLFALVLMVFYALLSFCMAASLGSHPTKGGITIVLTFYVILSIISLIVYIPSISLLVRRLHDTGRSGWWALLAHVPVAGLIVLLFSVMDSQPGMNKWGPNPKDYEREVEQGLYDSPYPNRAVVEEDW